MSTSPRPRPRAFHAALEKANLKPQCPTCRAPSDDAVWSAVLYDGEELGQCPTCGHTLDQVGRPACDLEFFKVIRLLDMARPPTDPLPRPVDRGA